VKLPVRVPSVVLKLFTVGPVVVDQQIPLTVTAPPPLLVIVPPETAEVKPIPVTAVVVRTGIVIPAVINVTSFP
jgi:hypothetical protein